MKLTRNSQILLATIAGISAFVGCFKLSKPKTDPWILDKSTNSDGTITYCWHPKNLDVPNSLYCPVPSQAQSDYAKVMTNASKFRVLYQSEASHWTNDAIKLGGGSDILVRSNPYDPDIPYSFSFYLTSYHNDPPLLKTNLPIIHQLNGQVIVLIPESLWPLIMTNLSANTILATNIVKFYK